MIKAILFDLGDTLISFRNADLKRAFLEGAKDTYQFLQEKLDTPLPDFRRYKWAQLMALRWAYVKSKITRREFNSSNVLRKCLKKFKITLPDEMFDELAWRWYKPLANQSALEDDAKETLEKLKSAGFKLAIVSNTFVPASSLDRHLAMFSILDYFPHRIYSCDIGIRKPNVRIFHSALEKLGVLPEQAVFVGDTYQADILGARKAGLFAIYKANKPIFLKLDRKTFLISKLREIPNTIDFINNEFGNGK